MTRFVFIGPPPLTTWICLLVWRQTGFEPAKALASGFTDRLLLESFSRDGESRTPRDPFESRFWRPLQYHYATSLYEILPEKARLIGMTYFKLRHTVLTSIKQVKDNYLLIRWLLRPRRRIDIFRFFSIIGKSDSFESCQTMMGLLARTYPSEWSESLLTQSVLKWLRTFQHLCYRPSTIDAVWWYYKQMRSHFHCRRVLMNLIIPV